MSRRAFSIEFKHETACLVLDHGYSIKQGDIKVMDDPKLASKLQAWRRSSPLSKLGAMEKLPVWNWHAD